MQDLDFGATIRGFSPGQKLFGRYTLQAILGRGGMGIVWRARDESLERDVALKLLPEIIAHDPSAVRDLKRETARSQQLSHPHILRIYDFVESPGVCGISMELIEGGTLTARRLAQPGEVFDVATMAPWVEQLLEALAYAHAHEKIVHRDLKPANLMLTRDDRLKVADFGIAASVSDTVSRASLTASSSGTPVYMSPQQMMGEKPAVTDDLYAVGATLYELLTGKPPFYTGNVILQARDKIPPSVAARREELGVTAAPVPPGWEAALAACLAKDPADRPQSAEALRLRLGDRTSGIPVPRAAPAPATILGAPAASLAPPRTRPRRTLRFVLGLILLAGVLGSVYLLYRPTLGPNARVGEGDNRTKLYAATSDGNYALVSELLRQGADPNLSSSFHVLDVGTTGSLYPLSTALQHDHAAIVDLLLNYGARWDLLDNSGLDEQALASAVTSDNPDLVRRALAAGVPHHEHAFTMAARRGQAEIMRLMLNAGYAPDHHFTGTYYVQDMPFPRSEYALHLAATAKDSGALEVLLKAGAAPNVIDHDGRTPLHLAAQWAPLRSVELLLEYGANPTIKTPRGHAPAWFASGDERDRKLQALSGG